MLVRQFRVRMTGMVETSGPIRILKSKIRIMFKTSADVSYMQVHFT